MLFGYHHFSSERNALTLYYIASRFNSIYRVSYLVILTLVKGLNDTV